MNPAGCEGLDRHRPLRAAEDLVLSAFGLQIRFRFALPELASLSAVAAVAPGGAAAGAVASGAAGHICAELAALRDLDRLWSGECAPARVARATVDGSQWTAELGRHGDLLMAHRLGRFHFDPRAARLLCAPADENDPGWRRLLLDTALVTVSLVTGHEALHAGCVVGATGAVAVAGPRGAGKTSLVLALVEEGARFLADDVVALAIDGDCVLANPGPPLVNVPLSAALPAVIRPLHRLRGEIWAGVEGACETPVALRAVAVVERSPQTAEPQIARLEQPAPALLAHALIGAASPTRQAARLTVLSRLAGAAEILSLRLPAAATPQAGARALLGALG